MPKARLVTGAILIVTLLVVSPVASTGSAASGRMAADRAAVLARTIVKGSSLKAAAAATREALSWGGVATADGKRVRVRAHAPAAQMRAWSREALNLAVEARDRETVGRLTLADLGRMLRDFKLPFPKASSPGPQLVELLKLWVAEARKKPGDSRSFTPLFLAAMAKYQKPAIDIAAGKYKPEQLRLTGLEVELFTAAFLRVEVKRRAIAVRSPAAVTATPCSDLRDRLDQAMPLGGSIVQDKVTEKVGEQLEKAVEHWTSAAGAAIFSAYVGAVNIAAKIQKLIAIYGSVDIRVFPQEADRVHKPREKPNVKAPPLHFTAIAGLSEADWQAYQRQARSLGDTAADVAEAAKDCLGFIGLPTPTTLGDLASEIERWHVTWQLDASSGDARVNARASKFDFPGRFRHHLRRVSPHEGAAVLAIDVQPERDEDHPGELLERDVYAHAQLDTSIPPSLQTFIDAMQGLVGGALGLASSIVELSAGWLQSSVGPKSYGTLEVTFHRPVCGGAALRSLSAVNLGCGFKVTAMHGLVTANVQINGPLGPLTGNYRDEYKFTSSNTTVDGRLAFDEQQKAWRGSVESSGMRHSTWVESGDRGGCQWDYTVPNAQYPDPGVGISLGISTAITPKGKIAAVFGIYPIGGGQTGCASITIGSFNDFVEFLPTTADNPIGVFSQRRITLTLKKALPAFWSYGGPPVQGGNANVDLTITLERVG